MKRLLLVAFTMAVGCNNPPAKISQDAPSTMAATGPSVTAKASPGPSATTDAGERSKGIRTVLAGQDTDALSLVRTERLKAKAEGRVLVVYVGAGWCEPCKRFKSAVQAGSLDDPLGRTTLLVFDADRDTDRLASAGYRFQFIPYVALPGADGHPTDSVEARGKGSEAWRDLVTKLEAWQAKGP